MLISVSVSHGPILIVMSSQVKVKRNKSLIWFFMLCMFEPNQLVLLKIFHQFWSKFCCPGAKAADSALLAISSEKADTKIFCFHLDDKTDQTFGKTLKSLNPASFKWRQR